MYLHNHLGGQAAFRILGLLESSAGTWQSGKSQSPALPLAPTWASRVTSLGHWFVVRPHTWQQLLWGKAHADRGAGNSGVLHLEEGHGPWVGMSPWLTDFLLSYWGW